MKKILILLLFSFTLLNLQGQKLDRTYYLLGTLDDYMGRQLAMHNPTNWGYIITLHQDRIGEIKRIEEVINKNFKKNKEEIDCANCQDFYSLKSILKARKINKFYDFVKHKGIQDLSGYAFYIGKLDSNKIINASETQQLSFIAGQFLTCGQKNNEIYEISLANSYERFECVKTIILKLGCNILKDEKVMGCPVEYHLYFSPSEKVKKVLDFEISRENTLANKG